jgi:hypothetical protein
MIREKGWECPRCQRIWAPKIGACGACNTDVDYMARQTQPPYPRFIAEDRNFVG